MDGTTFYGSLHVLYRLLIEKYPLANILIVTPLPRRDGERTNGYGKVLLDYVEAIKQTANNFSLPILDLYQTFGLNPKLDVINDIAFFDGLHPNQKGHERIFERMDAYIRNAL